MSNEINNEQTTKWDREITPKHKRFSSQLKNVWEYKDLIYLFVKRDFVIYYKQTIFGPLWYLFQPICSTIMYTFIFGSLAKLGTDSIPQPLFYFLGTMIWTYFSGSLIDISNIFFTNKGLFGKVFFPRLVVPIASMISLLLKLAIQFVLFIIMYIYFLINGANISPSWGIFLFPLVLIWISFLSCGIGMIISAITTKYRDIAMVLSFLVSLLMYATPVVYPISEVPLNLKTLLYLNPVSAPIEMCRYCFFGISLIPIWSIIYSVVMSIVLLVLGLVMFNKNERTFVDVI